VANYTKSLVEHLLEIDRENEYVLFFTSFRQRLDSLSINELTSSRVEVKQFKIPQTLLEFLWNRLHIFPIEWFIGPVDVFLSSDWTQPPTIKAKKVTTVHDLTPLKFPKEMHPKITAVHKRRMNWVKKECDLIMADSKATKKDLVEIIGVPEKKIRVIYLGY